jgi:hypothetical protein
MYAHWHNKVKPTTEPHNSRTPRKGTGQELSNVLVYLILYKFYNPINPAQFRGYEVCTFWTQTMVQTTGIVSDENSLFSFVFE